VRTDAAITSESSPSSEDGEEEEGAEEVENEMAGVGDE
jgi:hypothetical protein